MGIITDGCLLVLKALPVIALLAILLGEVVLRRHRARHPGRPAATLCGGHEYENRFVKLRDGRQLCFCLHGNQDPSAPGSMVVIYIHGLAGSRLEFHGFPRRYSGDLRKLSIITIDRPGYGLSDPDPNRTYESFSKDIAELADHLEVDKFHIVGWSSGGCYALAAGSFLGPRVIGIGSISTDPQWVDVPPSDPHNEKQYTALLRLFWLLTRPLWPVRNLALPVAGFLMSRLLLANLALSAAGNPRMQRIQHRLLESLRQGHRGATRDMVVERSPWGFCLKTHPSRVDLWHAIDDKAVPVMSVAYLADRLPDQQMILRRTGGHNMVVREWDAILELLINRKALPGPGEEAEAPAPAPPTPK